MEGENDILHDVNSDAFKNFNQILEKNIWRLRKVK